MVWPARPPFSTLLVLALAMSGLTGCSPALNWRSFSLEDADGLRVQFPCKPDVVERPLAWPASGESVTVRMHHCQADGMTWVVQTVTVDNVARVEPTLREWPATLASNLKQAIQGAADQAAAHGQARPTVFEVQGSEAIDVPGMTPMDVAASVDLAAGPVPAPGEPADARPHTWRRVRAWHFSHGHRVFEAAVWSIEDHKPAQSGEDVAGPFFEGLQFPG